MGKILHVARREYVETAKTKVFLISLLLTPVLVGGVLLFMRYGREKLTQGPRPARQIAVMDLSNALADELEQVFEEYNAAHPQRVIVPAMMTAGDEEGMARAEQLKNEVRQGKWDACVVITEGVVEGKGTSHYYTKSRKVGDIELFSLVSKRLQNAVYNKRFRLHDLSPQLVADLRRPVRVVQVDVSGEIEQKGVQLARLTAPFFFLFLMFMGLFGTSQGMLTSIIEEKNSRVIEVLLSSLSPFQLMAGKIIGLAALGFTVMLIWGTAAYGAAASQGFGHLLGAEGLVYFIIYFVLGFLVFSSVFAAIGSACNSLQEAQSLMTPLMILVIIPMMAWFYIAQYPDGAVAVVLSFIPLTAPMVMILRIAAHPDLSPVQIIASIVVLAGSVPIVMWGAAKIFRTGILMYGKQPSLRELSRWLRSS